jgi:2-oxoglutarate dehydrogenase E2 component (dihydrolipoamide succinyltransferase)
LLFSIGGKDIRLFSYFRRSKIKVMARHELVMPKMGESIMEATILKWKKKVGDQVAMDEMILDIATDKVDSEVPSTGAGTLVEILFNENDVVPVGKVIAVIDSAAGAVASPAPVAAAAPVAAPAPAATTVPFVPAAPVANAAPAVVGGNRFYSPLVLNIARQEGISMQELENIPGTGKDGRVSKSDILNYISKRGTAAPAPVAAAPVAAAPVAETPAAAPAPAPITGNVEVVEMDRMRKLIADHMVRSKATSPHVTSFAEADVTNLVLWRERIKKSFEKREGEKITYTPVFVEAVAKALKEFPGVNASVDGTRIILKKDINVGMATATPSGNLIVPVIKNADQRNLIGLTKEVNRLATAGRNNALKPEQIQDGTFTLTNVGSFGSLMGTPIINQPQVAIMAVGSIKKKPVVLETPQGDVIAIRHMMMLSMSYDHRIVDGALGGRFLSRVAELLENFDGNREL